MPRFSPLRTLTVSAFLLGVFVLSGTLAASEPRKSLADRAREAERKGDWLGACRFIDQLLRAKPQDESLRKDYQRCLRRLQLVSRHGDSEYRKTLAKLGYKDALKTCDAVLHSLNSYHADRERAELSSLVQQGLNEVALAVSDKLFREHYLGGVKLSVLESFENRVKTWPVGKIKTLDEAKDVIRAIVNAAANDGLPTSGPLSSALVMEFAAGACNGLDEHSCFLTPRHLKTIQSPTRAKFACLGIVPRRGVAGWQVGRVLPNSPADEAKLQEGDWLLKVGGELIDEMDEGELLKLLQPKAGELVDVEWAPAVDKQAKQTVKLEARVNPLPSVQHAIVELQKPGGYVGHLRINYFSEDTAREVKDALGRLVSERPIQGIILDLRGNPGGVLNSAVNVAELFLTGGVVSVSQSPVPEHNRPYKVESPGSVDFPLIVLIDGETASAAEVLAAALKEGRTLRRPVLMGQTTYGKGSVQRLILLNKTPLDKTAGIRLTVAKLFSPSNLPINGKGVEPDELLGLEVNSLEAAKKAFGELPMMMMVKGEGM